MSRVIATADIGSNTAHLLVAQVGVRGIRRLINESEWLSLGEVVSHEGRLPKSTVDQLVETLRTYKAEARSAHAEGFYVFATEAVRKASNHRAALNRIFVATGVKVDLVSPRREAELGLKGALLDCPLAGRFVLAETGGGSVQVALCEGVDILEEVSLPIGTGVLIDTCHLSQPTKPSQVRAAQAVIDRSLNQLPAMTGAETVLASGGVSRGLLRALHPDGDKRIALEEIEHLCWAAQRLNLPTISARYSVKAKRAATLLPGSLVYRALLRKLGVSEMRVSEFGVREGAVLEISQGRIVPCAL